MSDPYGGVDGYIESIGAYYYWVVSKNHTHKLVNRDEAMKVLFALKKEGIECELKDLSEEKNKHLKDW